MTSFKPDMPGMVKDIRAVLADCGLGAGSFLKDPTGSEYFIQRGMDGYEMVVDVNFRLKFDARRLEDPKQARQEILRGLEPFYESARAAPLVQRLEAKVKEQENLIRQLERYETYYDMEMCLRHGDPIFQEVKRDPG